MPVKTRQVIITNSFFTVYHLKNYYNSPVVVLKASTRLRDCI
jgi:hypothetical protein